MDLSFQVGFGVLHTPCQVYGCTTLLSAGLLYAACFIFSPFLFVMNIIGAAIGALLGKNFSSSFTLQF